jgi:AcrR family transcriptional regulator
VRIRSRSVIQPVSETSNHTNCMIVPVRNGASQVGEAMDPRVTRTRAHVLAIAREILLESGPSGLTYSSLSQRSKVTRQTLYRHWPTRQALLADLVLAGPEADYPEPGDNPRDVVVAFLTSFKTGLAFPARAAALLALAADAAHDPESRAAIDGVAADRRRALNALLAPSGRVIHADEFAGLCGPIMFRAFFSRGKVTRRLIEQVVDAWITC